MHIRADICAAVQSEAGAPAVWTWPGSLLGGPRLSSMTSWPAAVHRGGAVLSLGDGDGVCWSYTPHFPWAQPVTCRRRNSCSWLRFQSCCRCPDNRRTRTERRRWPRGRSTTWPRTADRNPGPESDCTPHLRGQEGCNTSQQVTVSTYVKPVMRWAATCWTPRADRGPV